jgi:hypothetical protein
MNAAPYTKVWKVELAPRLADMVVKPPWAKSRSLHPGPTAPLRGVHRQRRPAQHGRFPPCLALPVGQPLHSRQLPRHCLAGDFCRPASSVVRTRSPSA